MIKYLPTFAALTLLICTFLLISCGASSESVTEDVSEDDTAEPGLFAMVAEGDTVNTGRLMPSQGHIHSLVVFVTPDLPDDDWRPWPLNREEGAFPNPDDPFDESALLPFMREFIDAPDQELPGTSYENVTAYFRDASQGRMKVTGDVAYVLGPPEGALPDNARFGDYNKWVLQNRLSDVVDWSKYDSWHTDGQFVHLRKPNGTVDMILMVWRYKTNFLNVGWHGYARLGVNIQPYQVGDGFLVRPGTNRDGVSGMTVVHRGNWNRAYSFMIHEFAHLLIGSGHTYTGRSHQADFGFWGLFHSAYSNLSVNAYEADVLGWADVFEIESDTTFVMGDFFTERTAAKISFSDDTWLYLTNRQRTSPYDTPSIDEDDNGLFVSEFLLPYLNMRNNARPLVADGNYHWEINDFSIACNVNRPDRPVPVFTLGDADPAAFSYRDPIPISQDTTRNIFVIDSDPDNCTSYHRGQLGYTGFSDEEGRNGRLSPYSNPNTHHRNGNPSGISINVLETLPDGSMRVGVQFQPVASTTAGPAVEIRTPVSDETVYATQGGYIFPESLTLRNGTMVVNTDAVFSSFENISITIENDALLIWDGRRYRGGTFTKSPGAVL